MWEANIFCGLDDKLIPFYDGIMIIIIEGYPTTKSWKLVSTMQNLYVNKDYRIYKKTLEKIRSHIVSSN